MPQPSPLNPLHRSRLASLLAEHGVAAPRGEFAERLGRLVDLADSIRLSAAQLRRPQTDSGSGMPAERITGDFLDTRATVIQSAMHSFIPGAVPTRTKLPVVDGKTPWEEASLPEPWLKFYRARQRDVEFRLRNLRERVRYGLSGQSPELARLAALDEALGDIIDQQAARCYQAVPRLLAQRFEQLLDRQRAQRAGETDLLPGWPQQMQHYRAYMQSLLLAEIDARLLPVLGLVEALQEQDRL